MVNNLNNPSKACGKLNHPLYMCNAFQAMNVGERYKLINSTCEKCDKKHNILLHNPRFERKPTDKDGKNE